MGEHYREQESEFLWNLRDRVESFAPLKQELRELLDFLEKGSLGDDLFSRGYLDKINATMYQIVYEVLDMGMMLTLHKAWKRQDRLYAGELPPITNGVVVTVGMDEDNISGMLEEFSAALKSYIYQQKNWKDGDDA